jgi:simple sugar transport system permease protein
MTTDDNRSQAAAEPHATATAVEEAGSPPAASERRPPAERSADNSPPAASAAQTLTRGRLADYQVEIKIFLAFSVVFVVFVILAGSSFVTGQTWSSIMNSGAELGIVALGVTVLMIGGEFDLSVGTTFALTGMVVGLMLNDHTAPGLVVLILGIAMGAAIGAINGIVTVFLRIPSFITTLGSWLFWGGITLLVNQGLPVSYFGSSKLVSIFGGQIAGSQFRWEAIWWIGLALLVLVLMQRTRWGNWVHATGGSRKTAQAVGVNTRRVRLAAFTLTGALASFAGIVSFSHLLSMSPNNGDNLQLNAIAAAVIGGTALSGGVGRIGGVFVGTVLLSMLSSGLVLAGASTTYYQIFVGLIVIAAVAMHSNAKLPDGLAALLKREER